MHMNERSGLDISCQRPSLQPQSEQEGHARYVLVIVHQLHVTCDGPSSLPGARRGNRLISRSQMLIALKDEACFLSFSCAWQVLFYLPPSSQQQTEALVLFSSWGEFWLRCLWSWKKKKREEVMWSFFDVSFQDFTFNSLPECTTCCISGITPTFSSRATWRASRICSVKNVGYWNLLFFFFGRHLAAAVWMLLTFLRVCVAAEGLRRKVSGTQRDKITHRHLQRVSLLPSTLPPPPSSTPPPTEEPSRLLLAPPSADIFAPVSVGSQRGQPPVNSLD